MPAAAAARKARPEMPVTFTLPLSAPPLSDREAAAIVDLVRSHSGIVLSVARKSMIEARLGRRLRQGGFASYGDYLEFIRAAPGGAGELVALIDEITTNKTEFFRERHHFDHIARTVLPELSRRHSGRPVHVAACCVGCSTGDEPYSLAMVLNDHFTRHPGSYEVLGLDISPTALAQAAHGVYDQDVAQYVPAEYHRYLMRGKDRQRGRVRVVPEVRATVSFAQANITDWDFRLPGGLDLIFCRNVVIYFDRQTTADLVRKFDAALAPGGHLFIGHSESLSDLTHPFLQVAPTVYLKPRG